MLLDIFLESTGVSTDTRTVQLGNLFFALKGENFDGNKYALNAINSGAKYAIVDDVKLKNQNDQFIYVKNSLEALQTLARDYRRFLNKPVIALTGSNGKTTTKELINIVLSSKYTVHCTKGNLNNHIGVPLTILSSPQEIDILLIEMGANHQGEIDMLCHIAEPNFGLITNIGSAHLEGFGGIEGVKKGKSEIYRYLNQHNGLIFCNTSDPILAGLLTQNSNTLNYILDVELVDHNEYVCFKYKGHLFESKLFGNHNIANIIAAIEVGLYFKISMDDIAHSISKYTPDNNRSQITTINGKKIIKDAYNSNPSSLMASLKSLINVYNPESLVLILGDMLELGDYSKDEHLKILNFIKNYSFNEVWLIGKEFNKLKDNFNFRFYETTNDAKLKYNLDNYPNDTIFFLKGSRGIAVENIINV